jgi:chaperonin GroEL
VAIINVGRRDRDRHEGAQGPRRRRPARDPRGGEGRLRARRRRGLLRAIAAVEKARKKAKGDEKLGFDIVAAALEAPARQIALNAGPTATWSVEKIKEGEGNFGYDAAAGEYTDLVKAGIIDPAMVAKQALLHAASVAGVMLTTDVLVTDVKDEEEELVDGAIA